MKKTLMKIGLHTGIFVFLITILYLLLCLSCAIPNEKIMQNMVESAYYYENIEPFTYETGKKMSGVADNYADNILLNVSHHMGNGNPFISALDTKYFSGGEQLGLNEGFYFSVAFDAAADTDYTRYWHGGGMILRVLHLFTSVATIKLIGLAVALILLLITLLYLLKRKNYKTAIALLAASLCVNILNIRFSLEYQSTFIIGFAMCILYLLAEKKGDKLFTYLSVIGGTLTAFFDFLTCETMVILLPLVLVISVRAEENRSSGLKDTLKMIVKCIICFGAAYVGTFVAKWALATIVTGENKFALAFSTAGKRMSTELDEIETSNIFESMILAIFANLTTLFGGAGRVDFSACFKGIFISVAVLGSLFYLFRKNRFDKTAFWSMLILGSLVALRYILLSNHSYMHEFFTYRALITPIMAIFATVLLNTGLPEKQRKKSK